MMFWERFCVSGFHREENQIQKENLNQRQAKHARCPIWPFHLPFHPTPLCCSRRCPPRWACISPWASAHWAEALEPLIGWVLLPTGSLLISAVSCPTDPNTGHCSHLPKLHRPSSCRHTSLSPSPFGLWPPHYPCQGIGLKFSVPAHLYHAWCLGKVTGQEGPKHNHNNNKI